MTVIYPMPDKEIDDEPTDEAEAEPLILDDEESVLEGEVEPQVGAEVEDLPFPDDWPRPSVKVQQSIDAAAAAAGIPRPLAYALAFKESRFNPKLKGYKHGGNSEGFRKSYEKYKDLKIPGSSKTWGEMFPRPEDWTAYSLTQTLPFNAVGAEKPIKPNEPLSAMFDASRNARAGLGLLASHYEKHGDWFKALRAYNGAGSYARQVLGYARKLGWTPEAAVGAEGDLEGEEE